MAFDSKWAGVSDDWAADGNWDGADVTPVSNDDVLITGPNAQGIQTNVLGQGAVDLDSLIVGSSYTANIGASANALTISADLVKFFGSGQFWYADGAGITDEMHIVAANPGTLVNIGGATVTLLQALRGTLTLTGTITSLLLGYKNNINTDVIATLTAAAGTTGLVDQWGGSLTASNAITEYHKSGGSLAVADAGSMTTMYHKAGVTEWTSTGTVTTLHAMGGEINFDEQDRTIATLYKYPGAKVEYDEDSTIVTRLVLMGRGLAA